MKFFLHYPNRAERLITVDTIKNKKEVTAMRFFGQIMWGIKVEHTIDDEIIESFYALDDEHPKRPYLTSPKDSKEYNTLIFCGEEQLQHSIYPNEEERYYSIISNVAKEDVSASETKAGKSALYRTLLYFMQTNREKISFPSAKDREECRTLFGDEFVLVSESKQVMNVKNIINKELVAYQQMGKKFGLFSKNLNRNLTLYNLISAISQITDKKLLDEADYKEIVRHLVIARKITLDSHKKGSTFGYLGITSSRLAQSLDNCINTLLLNNYITQNIVIEIEESTDNTLKV